MKFTMTFFGQDFIISCYKILNGLNKQMKKKIENECWNMKTSSTDGGELCTTGFATSTVNITETNIYNKHISFSRRRKKESLHNQYIVIEIVIVPWGGLLLRRIWRNSDRNLLWASMASFSSILELTIVTLIFSLFNNHSVPFYKH